jgi:hypothetical protein
MPSELTHKPVPVEGRVLPKALINAQAATKHPLNCMDLKKGARRALHAILAFFNLKTQAAIFPSRKVLALEAGVSIQTLHRDLAELEAKEYIKRQPQKHKSAAAGANAGKFWIAPIALTQKALVLLGLNEVIHSQPNLKMRDGIYIEKEHTKEVQSSLKNTISAETSSAKSPANAVDRQTRLPKDLLPILARGVSVSGIFLLMKLARSHQKLLSDIVAYRMKRIETLGLQGRELFSYLRELAVAQNVDFAHLARETRNETQNSEDIREAKALQARLNRHCDGYEIRKGEEVLGIFRASENAEDCGRIETSTGSRPVNLRVAMAMLRSKVSVRPQAEEYFC